MELEKVQTELKRLEELKLSVDDASSQLNSEIEQLKAVEYQEALKEIFRLPHRETDRALKFQLDGSLVFPTDYDPEPPRLALQMTYYHDKDKRLSSLLEGPLKDNPDTNKGCYICHKSSPYGNQFYIVPPPNEEALLLDLLKENQLKVEIGRGVTYEVNQRLITAKDTADAYHKMQQIVRSAVISSHAAKLPTTAVLATEDHVW